ncbi:MAG: type II toxin-antitoxin system Phd/YefM family antitoxin [Clostridiales bacterium]|nr:type II toxin-antitoxin system Phd/YefM family antitoxin [Clostridiales bacterium]
MPHIRPISDLRNNANEISDYCKATREPVFITRNGSGDMVVMSVEMYERREAQLELYAKLAEAEAAEAAGDTGVDFMEFANKMRDKVHGTI